ncbi:MAG TPA: metallophosphoesterase family protein [Chloroflexota bacterium]|jgi:predicted phosphodiesterase
MRALVLSDVHGNLAALEAVLARAPAHDALWCLGDLVDFGPEPDQCVARLLELGARCVVGNHDRLAADGSAADGWTDRRLGASRRAALRSLPAELRIGEVTLRHGLADLLRPPALSDFASFRDRLLLVGHTHLPLLYRRDGRGHSRWLDPPVGQPIALGRGRAIANPGSVGSSFVDPGLASALLYDAARRELTWLAVPYPVGGVLERLRAAGAPAALLAGQRQYVAGELEPMRRARAEHEAWSRLSPAGAAPPASGS